MLVSNLAVDERFANGTQGRVLYWFPESVKQKLALPASHRELMVRFAKEGSIGKAEMFPDKDHMDVMARLETLTAVPGQPVLLQLPLVPSYGLAIIALTVVIRLALFPLSAGSIRNARRMRIAQPVMQKRQAEIRAKFASNPQKQQEELGKLMKEFGSPLAGCLPLLVQMPILFALFATLRGSPFADVP